MHTAHHLIISSRLYRYIGITEFVTFLLFGSDVGARDGSGMKFAMMAKKMTPPKNCVQITLDVINKKILTFTKKDFTKRRVLNKNTT